MTHVVMTSIQHGAELQVTLCGKANLAPEPLQICTLRFFFKA